LHQPSRAPQRLNRYDPWLFVLHRKSVPTQTVQNWALVIQGKVVGELFFVRKL
jgi:hypothetical protein